MKPRSGLVDEAKPEIKSKGLSPEGLVGVGLMLGNFMSILLSVQVIESIFPGLGMPIIIVIYGSLSVVQGYDFGEKHLKF